MMMPYQPNSTKELVVEAQRQGWLVTDRAAGWLCLTPTRDATIYVLDSTDAEYALNCLTELRRLGLRPAARHGRDNL
jgi:hypothetical protein